MTIDLYKIFYSDKITPFPKKYSVYVLNEQKNTPKLIHFGDVRYQQYYDNTGLGLYTQLNHLDDKRRKRYLQRATKIKNKYNQYTYQNPNYPNYWSVHYLW
jgi:hypothetical protein